MKRLEQSQLNNYSRLQDTANNRAIVKYPCRKPGRNNTFSFSLSLVSRIEHQAGKYCVSAAVYCLPSSPRYCNTIIVWHDMLCPVTAMSLRSCLRPSSSSCLDVHPASLVSVGDRSFATIAGPLTQCGTVFRTMSPPPHHLVQNLKSTYFGYRIRTLFSRLCSAIHRITIRKNKQ